MDGLHLNYIELSAIAAALLRRSAVGDSTAEYYRYVYDKMDYFLKNSNSEHYFLQEILP